MMGGHSLVPSAADIVVKYGLCVFEFANKADIAAKTLLFGFVQPTVKITTI